MMDRQNKLAILSSMSDENLNYALKAVGIDCGDYDEYDENQDSANPIESWSSLNVSVPSTSRPPIVDKSSLFQMHDQSVPVRQSIGIPMQSEEDELLAAGLL